MKNWFKKIKGIIQGTDFFWEMIVTLFFVGLGAIIIACVIYLFQIEQSLSTSSLSGGTSKSSTLNAEVLSKSLENIKKRSEEFSNSLTNPLNLADPSR